MRDLKDIFNKKTIDYESLLEYGFYKIENNYVFKKKICDNQFEVSIIFSEKEKKSLVIDLSSGDEFVLVDIIESKGEFVGNVRNEYNFIINDIVDKCTKKSVFKYKQTLQIIDYFKDKYNDKLEFLWEKFDDNAIVRNKKNNKWYAVILTVSERKLGLNSDRVIEILDLRYQKENINNVIDLENVFPGYHMNKKSWITIKLDDKISIDKIFDYIDNSYILSLNK